MISENKTRIIITIPTEMLKDIDTICGQMGLSRSQFMSMTAGEKIFAYKKAFEITSTVLQASSESLIKPIS